MAEAVTVLISVEDADRIADALCAAAASGTAPCVGGLEDLARELMRAIQTVRAGSHSLLSGE